MTPRFTIGDCAGGHRGDNREKNRDVLIVPRKSVSHTLHVVHAKSCYITWRTLINTLINIVRELFLFITFSCKNILRNYEM